METRLTLRSADGVGHDCSLLTSGGVDLCKALSIGRIDVSLAPNDLIRADICILMPEIDIGIAGARWLTKRPGSSTFEPIRSVSFADGTVLTLNDDGTISTAAPAGAAASD